MDENAKQIYQDIYIFLSENNIMTLASADKDPWVCTVYYGMDEKMNLFIVTDPNSEHGKCIEKNPNIAFSVFDSHTKVTEPKRGIQAKGDCVMVNGIKEVTEGLMLWHQKNPGVETRISIKEILKKLTDTKIYKITPRYLKFFNKQLYGKKEYGIIEIKVFPDYCRATRFPPESMQCEIKYTG